MIKVIRKFDVIEAGDHGYKLFRIPGLIALNEDELVWCCEARMGGRDWGQIDLVIGTVGVDGSNLKRQILKTDQSLPINQVSKNLSFPRKRKRVDGELKYPVGANNPVLIKDEHCLHFIYCVEYQQCFYWRIDFVENPSWLQFSQAKELTMTFHDFDYPWQVIATGPGHGIRLSTTGRLLVPVWLSTGEGDGGHHPSVAGVIYSDDQGETWQAGGLFSDFMNASETALIEFPEGIVRAYPRHEGPDLYKAQCMSFDGGVTWNRPSLLKQIPETVCMNGVVYHPQTNRILFAGPAEIKRKDLTLWAYQMDVEAALIQEGPAGYADAAVLPKGNVVLFYSSGATSGSAYKPSSLRMAVVWVD